MDSPLNPIRIFLDKCEAIQSQVVFHCSSKPGYRDLAMERAVELDSRVKKWLEESLPPELNQPSSNNNSQPLYSTTPDSADLVDSTLDYPVCSEFEGEPEESSKIILYHPDFADWSSIQPSFSHRVVSF